MIDFSQLFYQPFSAQREDFFPSFPSLTELDPLQFAIFPQIDPFQVDLSNSLEDLATKCSVPSPVPKLRLCSMVRGQRKKKTFYEKNICKYVIRKAIRCLQTLQYQQQIKSICQTHQLEPQRFARLYLTKIQQFSGIQTLKRQLKQQSRESQAFKQYLSWFLVNRYIRQICEGGQMADVKSYITYKNRVLLPGLRNIDKWNSNKPL